MNKILLSQAEIIAERLNDEKAIWFHYKAIKILGFQKCYELSSLTLAECREGKVKTSSAKYYNGCVMREIKTLGRL